VDPADPDEGAHPGDHLWRDRAAARLHRPAAGRGPLRPPGRDAVRLAADQLLAGEAAVQPQRVAGTKVLAGRVLTRLPFRQSPVGRVLTRRSFANIRIKSFRAVTARATFLCLCKETRRKEHTPRLRARCGSSPSPACGRRCPEGGSGGERSEPLLPSCVARNSKATFKRFRSVTARAPFLCLCKAT